MKKILAFLLAGLLLYFLGSGLAVSFSYSNDQKILRAGDMFNGRSVNGSSGVPGWGRGDTETTGANTVTEIVVNYRSLDTLGEVSVLFLAAAGVLALIGGKKKRVRFDKPNFILDVSSRYLAPLMILFGVYVFIHGHLTPGGGFQGGTIVAVAVLLLFMSHNAYRAPSRGLKVLESLSGLAFVLLGLAGLYLTGSFLTNFAPKGVMGSLFSAGLVPVIYILIGLKVGSEMTGIAADFMGDD